MSVPAQLTLLVTQCLSHEDAASIPCDAILDILTNRQLLRFAQFSDSAEASNALQRWNLRVTALCNSRTESLKSVGCLLAAESVRQSDVSLRLAHKEWHTKALALLAEPSLSHTGFHASFTFLKTLLSEFQKRTDLAKECTPIASKLVDHLVRIFSQPDIEPQLNQQVMQAMVECLESYPSTFKGKHAEVLERLAFAHLCQPAPTQEKACQLVARLYLIAKDKKTSIQVWTAMVQKLLAAAEQTLHGIATTLSNVHLDIASQYPAILPPITDITTLPVAQFAEIALQRFEALVQALLLIFRLPTKYPVACPADLIIGLLLNWLRIAESSVASTPQDSTRAAEHLALAVIHTHTARLLAQVAISFPHAFTLYTPLTLSVLANARQASHADRALRRLLLKTFCLVLRHTDWDYTDVKKSLDSIVDELSTGLTLLWIPASQPEVIASAKGKEKTVDLLKPKVFRPDQQVIGDVATSLSCLSQLFLEPRIPKQLFALPINRLLALATHPLFVSSSPAYADNAQYEILFQSFLSHDNTIRRRVLRCLVSAIKHQARTDIQVVQRTATICAFALQSDDAKFAEVAQEGLRIIDALLRPAVPPVETSGQTVLAATAPFQETVAISFPPTVTIPVPAVISPADTVANSLPNPVASTSENLEPTQESDDEDIQVEIHPDTDSEDVGSEVEESFEVEMLDVATVSPANETTDAAGELVADETTAVPEEPPVIEMADAVLETEEFITEEAPPEVNGSSTQEPSTPPEIVASVARPSPLVTAPPEVVHAQLDGDDSLEYASSHAAGEMSFEVEVEVISEETLDVVSVEPEKTLDEAEEVETQMLPQSKRRRKEEPPSDTNTIVLQHPATNRSTSVQRRQSPTASVVLSNGQPKSKRRTRAASSEGEREAEAKPAPKQKPVARRRSTKTALKADAQASEHARKDEKPESDPEQEEPGRRGKRKRGSMDDNAKEQEKLRSTAKASQRAKKEVTPQSGSNKAKTQSSTQEESGVEPEQKSEPVEPTKKVKPVTKRGRKSDAPIDPNASPRPVILLGAPAEEPKPQPKAPAPTSKQKPVITRAPSSPEHRMTASNREERTVTPKPATPETASVIEGNDSDDDNHFPPIHMDSDAESSEPEEEKI